MSADMSAPERTALAVQYLSGPSVGDVTGFAATTSRETPMNNAPRNYT
jgi:hypothetical protein